MSDVKSKVVMLPSKAEDRTQRCIYKFMCNPNGFDTRRKGDLTITCSPTRIEYQAQALYFLSNEPIKEGDWYINGGLLFKADLIFNEGNNPNNSNPIVTDFNKKIIATTDKSLKIIDSGAMFGGNGYKNLPEPSKEFIEVYVKAYNEENKIEEVIVEYETIGNWRHAEFVHTKEVLKVKNNTITIKKLKESWSREEVEKLFFKYADENGLMSDKQYIKAFNKFIQQNL